MTEVIAPEYKKDFSKFNGGEQRVFIDSIRPPKNRVIGKVNKKAYEKLAMERDEQVWGTDSNLMLIAQLQLERGLLINNVSNTRSSNRANGNHYKEPSDALYGETL